MACRTDAVKILVVDDNAIFRRYLKRALTAQPYRVAIEEAVDGLDAVNKARQLAPDLVLMDIRMPNMGGIEATRQIKQAMPAVKIIILSVHDLEEYREAAKAAGAEDYVDKQSLGTDLVSAIQRVLRDQE